MWGIDSFSFIWEDMYLNFIFENINTSNILFADSLRYGNTYFPFGNTNKSYYTYNEDSKSYPFYLKTPKKLEKYLYPDIVILNRTELNDKSFDDFFDIEKKHYKSNINNYIKLKPKYLNNEYLKKVFIVDQLDTNEYTIVEKGYLKRINDSYNGEWDRDMSRTKSNIIKYLNSLKGQVEQNKYYDEIFYQRFIQIIDVKYYSKEFLESNEIVEISQSHRKMRDYFMEDDSIKKINDKIKASENNALEPYYLVYIKESGEILYNYIQSKKILDLYKALCNYKSQPFKDRVEEFNEETKNGSNMKNYANMLEKVVENIAGKEIEKGIQSLFSFGATTLSNQLPKDLDDFELISFLIVK